jgi:hypothetical protein
VLNLIDAKPVGGIEKKGTDQGIDGKITFTDAKRQPSDHSSECEERPRHIANDL